MFTTVDKNFTKRVIDKDLKVERLLVWERNGARCTKFSCKLCAAICT